MKSKITTILSVLLCSLLLCLSSACSNHQRQDDMILTTMPQPNEQLFELDGIAIPSEVQLSQLSEAQLNELSAFIKQEHVRGLTARQQVAAFIDANISGFTYEGKNYPAQIAFDKRSGNCMTLAMLTYAVANALQVHSQFQVIYSAPILLDLHNDLAISSDHVRSLLFEQETNGVFFSNSSRTVVDYFPERTDRVGAVVSETTFLAMYYRNLAADALMMNNVNLSYALLKKGLELDPRYSPLINMMAVLHRRLGDLSTASQFYQYGINHADNKFVLLSNYRQLLLIKGDITGAQAIERQLLILDDPTPYEWYILGKEALIAQNYENATQYFTKFINDTPYFHQAYYELSRAQFALGEVSKARQSMQQALALAELPDNKRQYQAKLHWLNTD